MKEKNRYLWTGVGILIEIALIFAVAFIIKLYLDCPIAYFHNTRVTNANRDIYIDVIILQFTTIFLTTSLMAGLSKDNTKLIYWKDMVEDVLIDPKMLSFRDLSVYGFVTLFLSVSFFSLRLGNFVLASVFISMVVIVELFFKMIQIHYNKDQYQNKCEKEYLSKIKETPQKQDVMFLLYENSLIATENHEFKRVYENLDFYWKYDRLFFSALIKKLKSTCPEEADYYRLTKYIHGFDSGDVYEFMFLECDTKHDYSWIINPVLPIDYEGIRQSLDVKFHKMLENANSRDIIVELKKYTYFLICEKDESRSLKISILCHFYEFYEKKTKLREKCICALIQRYVSVRDANQYFSMIDELWYEFSNKNQDMEKVDDVFADMQADIYVNLCKETEIRRDLEESDRFRFEFAGYILGQILCLYYSKLENEEYKTSIVNATKILMSFVEETEEYDLLKVNITCLINMYKSQNNIFDSCADASNTEHRMIEIRKCVKHVFDGIITECKNKNVRIILKKCVKELLK